MGESSYAAWRAAAELPDNDPVCSHCGKEHCTSNCPELVELYRQQPIPARRIEISETARSMSEVVAHELYLEHNARVSDIGLERIAAAIQLAIDEAKEEKP